MSTEGGTRAIVAALPANLGIAVDQVRRVPGHRRLVDAGRGRSTRSPTPATRCCCWSAAGGPSARRRRSTRSATAGERYVYAFIVSIVLFSVGGLFALYEGVHKWQHPEPIWSRRQWVPIGVLVVAIVLEGYSFRTAVMRVERDPRRASRWWQFMRTAKAPELPVVLLEDTAALIGLVFALFGVALTLITGNGRWDAARTALIGLLLVVVAVVLGAGDEVAAARRVGEPGGPWRRSARRSSAGRSSR